MGELGGQISETLEGVLGLGPPVQGKLFLSVAAILLVWALRILVLRLVHRRIEDPRVRYQWSKGSAYVAFVLVLVTLAQIWIEAIQNMGTFLGLLTAGLAIALRDLVANMAGWGFIVLRHPFHVGDRIQIGDQRGDVVDLRLFQFTILEIGNWVRADQSTGRIVHIPNARIFSDPLANYTAEFPFVWHELEVLVTFESDWRRAKELVLGVVEEQASGVASMAAEEVKRASRKLLIFYRTLTPTVYTSVEDSGVLLTARFMCHVRQRRGMSQAIWEGILDAFAAEDAVDLAYPTRRLYTNLLEGKKGARVELPRRWAGSVDGQEEP